jgi:Tfp pilus assembly protein PilX
MMRTSHFRTRAARRAQRGISLLFALMALVILGLGAVALTRSVDTGTLIMGNLAFKQDTMAASSAGAEQAIAWLQANTGSTLTVLDSEDPTRGYYASAKDTLDPTGNRTSATNQLTLVNWDGSNCSSYASGSFLSCDVIPFTSPTKVNGNTIQWVITRLCDSEGAPSPTNLCVRPAAAATSTANDRGELAPGGRISSGIAGPYYRVIVRVQGPRNTVSYTESLVHF